MTTRISVLAAAVVLAVSQPLPAAGGDGQPSAPPVSAASGLDDAPTASAVPEAKTWIMIGIGIGFTLFRMSAYSRRVKRFGGR